MKYSNILISLIVLIILSGCSHSTPKPQITKIQHYYESCPKQDRPNLPILNKNKHLGSKENLQSISDMIIILSNYAKSLENTINCYESQSDN